MLYFNIIVALSSRDILQKSDLSKDTVLEVNRVRNQVARTLVINGIVFFICQIPSRIDNLDDFFDYLNVKFDLFDYKESSTVTAVGHAFLFLKDCPLDEFTCETFEILKKKNKKKKKIKANPADFNPLHTFRQLFTGNFL